MVGCAIHYNSMIKLPRFMKFLVMMHSSPKRGIRNSRIKMSSYGSDEILFIDSFVSCITVELADFMAGKLVCCALKLSENTERYSSAFLLLPVLLLLQLLRKVSPYPLHPPGYADDDALCACPDKIKRLCVEMRSLFSETGSVQCNVLQNTYPQWKEERQRFRARTERKSTIANQDNMRWLGAEAMQPHHKLYGVSGKRVPALRDSRREKMHAKEEARSLCSCGARKTGRGARRKWRVTEGRQTWSVRE